MPSERDEDTGRFSKTYPDAAFLDALDGLGGTASTREIAESVGCPIQRAYDRLSTLADEGRVDTRMVGNSRLWTSDE